MFASQTHSKQRTRKRPRLGIVAVLTLLSLFITAQPQTPAAEAQSSWQLTWSDEFNGAANTSPDPAKWQIEVVANPANNEAQYYTNRLQNVRQNGAGQLELIALKEAYGGKQYTSGRINTAGKFEQTYGRWEARMKLPRGAGLWPAFWMLGNNMGGVGWPQAGEIDWMENRGRSPYIVNGALHGPGYSGNTPLVREYNMPTSQPSFFDDYHTFSGEWDTAQIRWYVDGNLFYTVNRTDVERYGNWVYDHPFFIILNLAVGGVFDNNTLPPDSALPARVLVDYVRVYRRSNDPPPPPPPGGAGYFTLVNRNSGRCADVPNGSTADGAGIQQWGCNSSNAQQWELIPTDSGYYRLISRASGKAMSIVGGATTDGALIHQWPWIGNPDQQWAVQPTADGWVRLVARNSGKALSVVNGATGDGVRLHQWPYGGGFDQQWRLAPVGAVTLVNTNSNKCVDVAGGNSADGTNIQLWGCNGSGAQRFSFQHTNNGYYRLINQAANKPVDVAGNSTADGANIHIWSNTGCACQEFRLEPLGDGSVRLVARHSGKVIDVSAGGTADGTNIQQWSWNGSTAQRFRISN
ncbi:MAG TPA: RICIN domain-containing protein [Herpetosiphonaceae bacterium]